MCRRYLNEKGFTHISRTGGFSPPEFMEIYTAISCEKIQENFKKEVEKISGKLKDLRNNGTSELMILIENGDPVTEDLETMASDYKNSKAKIDEVIIEIFELLSEMEENSFVHGDLKPSNFLYKTINGKNTIILNDFDASYVLPRGRTYKEDLNPRFTMTYCAPELVGMFDKRIGYWTDVFTAATISYQLLNDYKLPEQYVKILEDTSDQETQFKKLFKRCKDGKIHLFDGPHHDTNEAQCKAILSGLNLTPRKRKKAKEILSKLKGNVTPIVIENVIRTSQEINESRKGKLILPVIGIAACAAIMFGIIFLCHDNKNEPSASSSVPMVTENTYLSDTDGTTAAPVTVIADVTAVAVDNSNNSGNVSANEINISGNQGNVTIGGNYNYNNKNINENHNTIINNNDNSDHHSEINNEISISAEQPVPTEQEDNSPYEWEILTLHSNEGLFDDVEGVIITGYKDRNSIPQILEIPSEINGRTVVCIGNDAFNNCNICELIVPDSVYQIDSNAFSNCSYLWNIILGSHVYMIGSEAFSRVIYDGENEPRIELRNPYFGQFKNYFGENWAGIQEQYMIFDVNGEEVNGIY